MDKNFVTDDGHGKKESRTDTHTQSKGTKPCAVGVCVCVQMERETREKGEI